MPILNYTTKIDSYKTISEIQQSLAGHKAQKIIIDNDSDGNPVGLTFCILWKENMQAFTLPCNFNGVLKAMYNNKKVPRAQCTKEQALRVGWRILKDWVEAQMAIIESELASMQEVFLPYAITKSGETVFKHLENNQKLLG